MKLLKRARKSLSAVCVASMLTTSILSTSTLMAYDQSTIEGMTAQVVTMASTRPEVAVTQGLLAHYKFDETSGTVATDTTGNYNATLKNGAVWLGEDGVSLDGVNDYVQLPSGMLNGLEAVTVSTQVYVDATAGVPTWIFNFGSTTNGSSESSADYLGFLLESQKNNYRVPITTNTWSAETNTRVNEVFPTGVWKTVTYTQNNKVGTIYLDGVKVAENTSLSVAPKDITNTLNFIGRAPYTGDKYLKGKVRDFRVYNRALSDTEVKLISEEGDAFSVMRDVEVLSLGDISAVTENLELPAVGEYGSSITWISSDTSIVEHDGTIHRPAADMADVKAILTAIIAKGDNEQNIATKTFEVTIKRLLTDVEKVEMDKEVIVLYNLEDIRGNMTLPQVGENGSTITWNETTGTITPTGEVTRPAHGEGDSTVTLRATLTSGLESDTKEFTALIKEMPEQEDLTGYLFTYFIGEGSSNGEQMYFALSQGNNPLYWDSINGGKPVLTAKLGDEGLRDPVIVRSPEGDKFYMIATDLRIYGNGDWGGAQKYGSKSIFVWESTDLINWSDQRLVQVSPEEAGNTWAPEIIYDDETGEYVVYWSSKIYTTPDKTDSPYNRIMYTKTRDFYTFTPAQEYFNPGYNVIDTVMIKANDKVYRFTKDERNSSESAEGKMIFQEVGSSIFADDFKRTENDFVKTGTRWVEGPLTFKDNLEEKWYLFVDDFGGEGYIPFYTTDLDNGEWIKVSSSNKQMPTPAPRHGTILPLTTSEYARLKAHNTAAEGENNKIEIVTGVNLQETLELNVGEVANLVATVAPAHAVNQDIIWSTSDGDIVSIDSMGKATGLGIGTADITVTTVDGNYKATCTVTVENNGIEKPVADVVLNHTELELKQGRTATLVATVTPEDASYPGVVWSTSNESVVTVDDTGRLTAVGVGIADIIVTTLDGGKTATCQVTVIPVGNEMWYKFDEEVGTTAGDSFENRGNASFKGNVSWIKGLIDGAAYLDGGSSYIQLPDALDINANSTIELWVKEDEQRRWARVFDFGPDGNSNMFLTSYGSPSGKNNSVGLHIKVGSIEDTIYAPGDVRLPRGVWTHLAITFEGSTAILYINGEEVGRNEKMRLNPSQLTASSNYLGKSKYSADPYFKGAVDNLRIHDKALSQEEITASIKDYIVEEIPLEEVTISNLEEQVDVMTKAGIAPELPQKVDVTYSNGMEDKINVKWDKIDASMYETEGSFEVTGTVTTQEYADFIIEDRADPWVYKHTDGYYYFTASYTNSEEGKNNVGQYQYTELILRRAKTIQELQDAEEVSIYHKDPLQGTKSPHIWAPEIHYINGKWYIYFTQTISETDQWAIRPHVIECDGDPMVPENWSEPKQLKAAEGDTLAFSGFSLDHTYFEHNGRHYVIWAQNNPNSNLYIAELAPDDPSQLISKATCIAMPTYDWELKGYKVNEGASVIKRNGNIYVSYSASATDCSYAMGLLTISENSDPLDSDSWSKYPYPVMVSNDETGIYGPGHSSFTVSEDGTEDILIYHGRPERKQIGSGYEPLYDSGRHTYAQKLYWNPDGTPYFGIPRGSTLGEERTVTATVTVTPNDDSVETVPEHNVNTVEKVNVGDTFEVTIGVNGGSQKVYSKDFIINYNQDHFTLLGYEGVDLTVVAGVDDSSQGQLRLLLATEGGLANKEAIKLTFRAKEITTTANSTLETTNVLFGLIDEGEGTSKAVEVKGIAKTITIVANEESEVDKLELRETITKAEEVSRNAIVGDEDGEYPQVAKDTLDKAIQIAKQVEQISKDQSEIDQATIVLNKAIEVFKASENKPHSGDVTEDGAINVGDLALAAYYYKEKVGSDRWEAAQKVDVVKDGDIDILDLSYIAQKILEMK